MSDQVPQAYWKALFEFAAKVGAEDSVNRQNQRAAPMSEEDRKFLQNAMAQLVNETDPVRQMKKQIDTLCAMDLQASQSESDRNRAVGALENLQDLCADIDCATDFYKIGGFRLLVPLLCSDCAEFRAETAALLGELAQNNPFIQTQLQDAKILPLLLAMLDNDTVALVRTKVLFAISCLARSNEQLVSEFISLDGFGHLLRAINVSIDDKRFVNKAAFLLSNLITDPAYKEYLASANLTNELVGLLLCDTEAFEFVLSALATLAQSDQNDSRSCITQHQQLREFLESKLKQFTAEDEKDQRNQVNSLLRLWDNEPSR